MSKMTLEIFLKNLKKCFVGFLDTTDIRPRVTFSRF